MIADQLEALLFSLDHISFLRVKRSKLQSPYQVRSRILFLQMPQLKQFGFSLYLKNEESNNLTTMVINNIYQQIMGSYQQGIK
jgi:hypothetical protein